MRPAKSATLCLCVAAGVLAAFLPTRAASGDDGLVVREITTIRMLEDGRIERSETRAIKPYTEIVNSRGAFDPTLTWNDAEQTLEVTEAYTIMADGTRVEPAENSFVPNTDFGLAWAPDFARVRQQTVVQIGIEPGATAVLSYVVTDREPREQPLWGEADFHSWLPIAGREVTFELPDRVRLRYAGVGCTLQPEITRADGVTRYSFRLESIPAVNVAERSHAQPAGCRLVYSTAAGWEEVYGTLVDSLTASTTTTPDLADKARELAGGALLVEDRVATLHGFVLEGLRTLRLPAEVSDVPPRPAARVLETSAGTPVEKAALLAAMLRAVDVEADIAFACTYACHPAPGVPAPVAFDRPWVVIRGGGEHELWIDPTRALDAASVRDVEGHAVMRPLAAGHDAFPPAVVDSPAAHGSRLSGTLTLAPAEDGEGVTLSGTVDAELRGRYQRHPVLSLEKDRAGQLGSQVAAALGGATVDSSVLGTHSRDRLAARVTLSHGHLERVAPGLYRLELPRAPGGVTSGTLGLHRQQRTLPLSLGGPVDESVRMTLTLGEKLELTARPKPVEIRNGVGTLTRTVTLDDRVLTVETTLTIGTSCVAPEDYANLRSLLSALEAQGASQLLVRDTR